VAGDIRLSPFYDIVECRARVEKYVEVINAQLDDLNTRGPYSKYDISEWKDELAPTDV